MAARIHRGGRMNAIRLLPRLYLLDFPVGHAYLWQGSDGLTLIDPSVPGSAPRIAAASLPLPDRA